MSTMLVQALTLVTGSFLSGAMTSLSLIAVPVFLDTTTEAPQLLLQQWTRMYHYGHVMLPTMAVGTSALHLYVAARKRGARKPWRLFALAGVATALMVPFTWIVMAPTNGELFRLAELSRVGGETGSRDLANARNLVMSWAWMHLGRSLSPLVGAVVGAVGTLGDRESGTRDRKRSLGERR
ncbi:hypothetical protein C8A03DRAFT_38554 [Achaetomium macrosporum]|uniref:DUF1772-domain-containing protein n=1 Tax=Achaetomium macrosporum TaxID=79813 RepID=A0AAN7C3D0_9PEZI|nr:hypothetical protein C8A03DRAFT_38554 [Achaetomium macrosporum]